MADSNVLLSPEPAQSGVTDNTIQPENNSSVEVDERYDDDDDDDDFDVNNTDEESVLRDFDIDNDSNSDHSDEKGSDAGA